MTMGISTGFKSLKIKNGLNRERAVVQTNGCNSKLGEGTERPR